MKEPMKSRINWCASVSVIVSVAAISRASLILAINNHSNNIAGFDAAGHGSIAIDSHLGDPRDAVTDPLGNLYVASGDSNSIEEFAANGSYVRTYATANLDRPIGLAFDHEGDLFVANQHGNNLIKITPEGTSTVFAPSFGSQPYDIAIDGNDDLFVTYSDANIVAEFTPAGNRTTFASTGLNDPTALNFNHSGDLFVANQGGNYVERFTPAGIGSLFVGPTNAPGGLVFDGDDNMYLSAYTQNYIEKYSSTGVDLGRFADTDLDSPQFLAIGLPDPSGGCLVIVASLLLTARSKL